MDARALDSHLRRLRRRASLDFSDYLELRHLRDHGAASPELDRWIAQLERALDVRHAACIPNLATLAPGTAPPPRDLTPDALALVFRMREEFASHGRARSGMMGFDLPEGQGLKDWLDFVETEREQAKKVREGLRRLDGKIWALLTGERRLPAAPNPFATASVP